MKCYLFIFMLFLIKVQNSLCKKNDQIFKSKERQTENNNNKNNNLCSQNCLKCEDNKCLKCVRGEYSLANSCYQSCPGDTLSDNYSFSCKREEENPIYIKAYTFSRCLNKCGSVFNDCSCDGNCIKKGNCCSDFKYCSYLNESLKSNNKCTVSNCKACSSDNAFCLMCEPDFYFYNNSCYSKCPENTVTIKENNLCIDSPKCNIQNCEACDNTKTKCLKCLQGFYLHENECDTSCPLGTRANRIDFTCVNKSTFAFFMIFPSKYSCKNRCSYIQKEADCSCHHHCLKDGNCCDDFEQECREEIKTEKCKACEECIEGRCVFCGINANLSNGDCNCKNGYYYNIEQDKCLSNSSKIKNRNNQNDPYSRENLEKLLINFFNKDSYNINDEKSMRSYGNSHMSLNGNITLNIFSGNENPSIVNENVVNENSFNNLTNVEKNINSKNVIVWGTSTKRNYSKTNHLKKQYKSNIQNFTSEINDNDEDDELHFRKNMMKNDNIKQGKFIKLKHRKKIDIDKHFHLDHSKHFPEDLDHEQENPLQTSENSMKISTQVIDKTKDENSIYSSISKSNQNGEDSLNKSQNLKKNGNVSQLFEPKKDYSSKVSIINPEHDKIIKTLTDQNEKVHININIPGQNGNSSQNNSNVITRNKVTVYNHYFINDKSVSMNKPNNPNVFNFYGNGCKSGKCLKNEIGDITNTQFISDKDFKEVNNTLTVKKSSLNIGIDREESQKFSIPLKKNDEVQKHINSLNLDTNLRKPS